MQKDQAKRASTAGALFFAAFLWMLTALPGATEAAGSDGEDPPARGNWAAATEDTIWMDVSPDGPDSAQEAQRPDKRRTESWVIPAIRAPRLQRHLFHSTAARGEVSCHVYTPEAYDAEPDRRFPVVYWLHGAAAAQRAWFPAS